MGVATTRCPVPDPLTVQHWRDSRTVGNTCGSWNSVRVARGGRSVSASPWGAVGKVPQISCGNSLSAYPTSWTATTISMTPRTAHTPACSADSFSGTVMWVPPP
jgi:hypothetical protein